MTLEEAQQFFAGRDSPNQIAMMVKEGHGRVPMAGTVVGLKQSPRLVIRMEDGETKEIEIDLIDEFLTQ